MRKLITLPSSPWGIKPDTLIFTDLHLHERKEFNKPDPITGLNSRLMEGLSILDQIIDIIHSHPEIGKIKFLGDFFELKDRVPNHILIEFQRRIEELSRTIVFTAIRGNHDYSLPKYPTLSLFTHHIQFITDPQIIDEDGVRIAYLPFQREEKDFYDNWGILHKESPNLFLFHQELPGAEYESGRKIPGEVPPSIFDPNIIYISGHLHKYQNIGKVTYLGSPYQIKFSDEGCSKYIMLFNSISKQRTLMELHYSKFVSLDIEGFEASIDNVHDNYVRIVGEAEDIWTSEYRKELKDRLEHIGAKGISFQVKIKKPHQTSIPEDKIENDDEIISLYAEENKQTLDKERLIKIGLETFHSN